MKKNLLFLNLLIIELFFLLLYYLYFKLIDDRYYPNSKTRYTSY